jgi:hypothetical protein
VSDDSNWMYKLFFIMERNSTQKGPS